MTLLICNTLLRQLMVSCDPEVLPLAAEKLGYQLCGEL